MLVVNQLHRSSSALLIVIRFYEHVSTMSNPATLYLRLLQASFGGYVSAVSTSNSEYQQRWSAFVFFQLPRLLASCFESQLDHVKQAIENFLLHNEYLLNRTDELCVENVMEQVFRTALTYTKSELRQQNQTKFDQLAFYIQKLRGPFVQQIQQYYQNQPTRKYIDRRPTQMRMRVSLFLAESYSHQTLQSQRSLEQSLVKILSSNSEENLQALLTNLTDYIPLICAVDQYYPFVRSLLTYMQTHFDLALLVLCYVTSITDDISEDFGHLELGHEPNSPSHMIYIWLKKYWLSRHLGHALFASSLESIELLSNTSSLLFEASSNEREDFLNEIKTTPDESIEKKYSDVQYLGKTIHLLGDLPSLALDETKETVSNLIAHLTKVSYGSLAHVLLWLMANYQIANDNDRAWIQTSIHTMGREPVRSFAVSPPIEYLDDEANVTLSSCRRCRCHDRSDFDDQQLI